jgi:hypothetical protein
MRKTKIAATVGWITLFKLKCSHVDPKEAKKGNDEVADHCSVLSVSDNQLQFGVPLYCNIKVVVTQEFCTPVRRLVVIG